MKKSELKSLIREAVEEVMKEFAPLGVANEERLDEKTPPNFPAALKKKIFKQYGQTPKAYATMWTLSKKMNEGDARVCEMWTAYENKSVNEAEEMDQNAEHDETDLNNPEEKQEVELAKQIKKLADELLTMHGVEAEEGEAETEQGEEAGEETK